MKHEADPYRQFNDLFVPERSQEQTLDAYEKLLCMMEHPSATGYSKEQLTYVAKIGLATSIAFMKEMMFDQDNLARKTYSIVEGEKDNSHSPKSDE